jgi:hypothetical protein
LRFDELSDCTAELVGESEALDRPSPLISFRIVVDRALRARSDSP